MYEEKKFTVNIKNHCNSFFSSSMNSDFYFYEYDADEFKVEEHYDHTSLLHAIDIHKMNVPPCMHAFISIIYLVLSQSNEVLSASNTSSKPICKNNN